MGGVAALLVGGRFLCFRLAATRSGARWVSSLPALRCASRLNEGRAIHDSWITRHLRGIRVLVAKRSARFLVRLRRLMGPLPLWRCDQDLGDTVRCPSSA